MGQGCYLDKETIYTLNLMPFNVIIYPDCNMQFIIHNCVYSFEHSNFYIPVLIHILRRNKLKRGGGGKPTKIFLPPFGMPILCLSLWITRGCKSGVEFPLPPVPSPVYTALSRITWISLHVCNLVNASCLNLHLQMLSSYIK